MGFDYTKIKFFILQKLVSKYTIRAHFPTPCSLFIPLYERFYGDISRYVTY